MTATRVTLYTIGTLNHVSVEFPLSPERFLRPGAPILPRGAKYLVED